MGWDKEMSPSYVYDTDIFFNAETKAQEMYEILYTLNERNKTYYASNNWILKQGIYRKWPRTFRRVNNQLLRAGDVVRGLLYRKQRKLTLTGSTESIFSSFGYLDILSVANRIYKYTVFLLETNHRVIVNSTKLKIMTHVSFACLLK